MAKMSKNTGGSTQKAFTGNLRQVIKETTGIGSDIAGLVSGKEPVISNVNSAIATDDLKKALGQIVATGENTKYGKTHAEETKQIKLINALKEKNELYSFLDNEDIVLNELANQNTANMQAFNASEAEKNRQWQTQMSNTSHQREVADLRAAGLNPVLSANSGATAYTSSPASSTIDSAIGALANKEISRLTTAATVKAAEISAEMVGRAAEISANASRYASDMAYRSTKYSANKGLAGMQASAAAQRAAAGATAAATKYAAEMNYAGTKYNTDYTRTGSLWGTFGSYGNRADKTSNKSTIGTFLNNVFGNSGSNHNVKNRAKK